MPRMKTIILISAILIGLLAYLQFNTSLSESEALSLLTKTIHDDALYESFTTLQCLEFYSGKTTKESFNFAVYEIHGGGCKGDPNTHPRIDTFKIMRESQEIFYYDVLEDSYFPYNISKLKR